MRHSAVRRFVAGSDDGLAALPARLGRSRRALRTLAARRAGRRSSRRASPPPAAPSPNTGAGSTLELRGRGRSRLAGHSMGAALAILAAAESPELVERLVLIAPAGLPLQKPIRESARDFVAAARARRLPAARRRLGCARGRPRAPRRRSRSRGTCAASTCAASARGSAPLGIPVDRRRLRRRHARHHRARPGARRARSEPTTTSSTSRGGHMWMLTEASASPPSSRGASRPHSSRSRPSTGLVWRIDAQAGSCHRPTSDGSKTPAVGNCQHGRSRCHRMRG